MSASGHRPAGPQGETGQRGSVVAALMLSMALVALDGTILSTSVPSIVADLGGFSIFSWLFAGYLLAITVSLPVYGKLCDTVGRKPVLVFGIVLFLLGSVLCAMAWNMGSLIAFRIIQGLGGGALQGTVHTIASDLYPLKERPRIQSRLSIVWGVSAVTGPAVGGVLATYADWRWIFLINVPVGLVALWLIVRQLRESAPGVHANGPGAGGTRGIRGFLGGRTADGSERAPIDWLGALTVFAAGTALLAALVQGGIAWSWFSAPSLALLGTGAVLIVALVLIERRAAEPMLPGWVWRRPTIAAVNLALCGLGVLMTAPAVFLPTYAQSVMGLDPIAAGLVLSVMTLSWPVTAAWSNRIYNRIGFRQTAMIGVGCAALVLAAFPLLPYPPSPWQPALMMLLLGAALGIFQLPLIVGVQSTVVWYERGVTTASVLFYRQIGQSVGAAVFGAVGNAVLASRLGGTSDLDSVSRTLEDSDSLSEEAADGLRRAVDAAVDHVFVGGAVAAVLALLALLLLAPRHFPVIDDEPGPGQNAEGTADDGRPRERTEG
ncbi:MFS transporter [Streptomyces clavuligerus]|nr:MFS transporter [Streptomyces clavuligerus]WDN55464.1 MFS transporter [Streptomyces clavuligerus]